MGEVNTIGVLPLGRPTFDVEFAEQKLDAMLKGLIATGKTILGSERLLMDAATTEAAIADLKQQKPDVIVVLQVTFTDASAVISACNAFTQPLCIWAVPEPRLGGRLRLNAFCGLNLASHALGLAGRVFSWLYADPQAENIDSELAALLAGKKTVMPLEGQQRTADTSQAQRVLAQVKGSRIARLGAHPDGFDTCKYDPERLLALAGIEVDELPLDQLFDTARGVPDVAVDAVRAEAKRDLQGLEDVDPQELDKSLRLKSAIEAIRASGHYDAFAIRCWPETFTEYGGAVCGPVAMMGQSRVPCACEADVYGAATQLVLQSVVDAPVFLADLVDMDIEDNTGVVWHCGQAPISMAPADVMAQATIHTNRKMPLLYQFPLKQGRVTLMRISQAHGVHKMIIASGRMLQRPMAFTGTSGVVEFDRPVRDVLPAVMDSGLEHHMALAYGDHTEPLVAIAAALELPVIHLCQ